MIIILHVVTIRMRATMMATDNYDHCSARKWVLALPDQLDDA